jgi:hypothetical protein
MQCISERRIDMRFIPSRERDVLIVRTVLTLSRTNAPDVPVRTQQVTAMYGINTIKWGPIRDDLVARQLLTYDPGGEILALGTEAEGFLIANGGLHDIE